MSDKKLCLFIILAICCISFFISLFLERNLTKNIKKNDHVELEMDINIEEKDYFCFLDDLFKWTIDPLPLNNENNGIDNYQHCYIEYIDQAESFVDKENNKFFFGYEDK